MKITSLVMKVTESCNLGCSHCGFYATRPRTQNRMSLKTIQSVFERVREYLNEDKNKGKNFRFTWHGGEPLTLGLNFFEDIINLQKKIFQREKIINSLQTNGTYINQDWAIFFRKNKFNIGISIEGSPRTQNVHRAFLSGKESYKKVVEGLKILQHNNIQPDALCVIHPNEDGKETFLHLIELGFKSMDFLPLIENYSFGTSQNRNISKFMIDAFDAWYDLGDPSIQVRSFSGMLHNLLEISPKLCTLADNCTGHLTVEADGTLNNCEVLNITSEEFFSLGGKITDLKLSNFEEKSQLSSFLTGDEHIAPVCKTCDFYSVCKGGCPSMRFKDGAFTEKSIYCHSYMEFISHIMHRTIPDLPKEYADKISSNGKLFRAYTERMALTNPI